MNNYLPLAISFACVAVPLTGYLFRKQVSLNHPPIAYISDRDLFCNPRRAYESAINQHGSVVGVRRKNRLEYIVDHTLAAEVLTNDAVFSFERGTLSILNLGFLLAFPRSFIVDIDRIVHDHIISDLNACVSKVSPILDTTMKKVVRSSQGCPISVDATVHRMMAEAMLTLILGENYTSDDNISATEEIALAVATLTGMYENLGWSSRAFPGVYRLITSIKVLAFSIPYHLIRSGLGRRVFKGLSQEISAFHNTDSVLFAFARTYANGRTGRIPFFDRIWIMVILLGLIFASVHQTAVVIVWVLLELGKRPEYADQFREETVYESAEDGTQRLTHASVRNAERLDSFIREVMRTKGDTLSTVRQTTSEAALGGYTIPKGSFVIPLATLVNENENYHGDDAREFIGDRWIGTGKPAIMLSPTYWPFGFGRWSCPGRALAVAEIKLAVMSILTYANVSLENGVYEVVDPMNVTSASPRGRLIITELPK